MVTVALLVRLEAKPGKEAEVESFLKSGLAIVEDEPDTTAWFAIRMGPSTPGPLPVVSGNAGPAVRSISLTSSLATTRTLGAQSAAKASAASSTSGMGGTTNGATGAGEAVVFRCGAGVACLRAAVCSFAVAAAGFAVARANCPS